MATAVFWFLFGIASTVAVGGIWIIEQRRRFYKAITSNDGFAEYMREMLSDATATEICIIASALCDEARTRVDRPGNGTAYALLAWIFSGLRPAYASMQEFVNGARS